MEWTEELKTAYIEGAQALKGHARRVFMARIVKALGRGGPSQAERELGWCRKTIGKGLRELESGVPIQDNFAARGRKRAEARLPRLLEDIRAIADEASQTDPTFQTTRLYTRLSAAEMRRQLILQKGYSDAELPSEETIRVKMNKLGYGLRSVQKSRPKKRFQKLTLFLNSSRNFIRKPGKTRAFYGFRWMLKRRSLWAGFRVMGGHG